MSLNQLKVLVLSQSYEPIQIVCWEDAVTMVYLEKVEVLAEYEVQVHSQHCAWSVPAVIRLLARPSKYNFRVRLNKEHVFRRDNYTCLYCGQTFKPKALTYDHVVPRSRGGLKTWENIATSCERCNQKKGGRTPQEAHMHLLKPLTKPRWYPALLAEVNGPDEWEPYLEWVRKRNGQS